VTRQATVPGAMDIVFLHGLEVDAVIGIWDWERQFEQTLEIDVDMGTDIRQAARSDAIEDTIDYKAVTKRIMGLAREGKCLLVERLIEEIAETVLREFDVHWIRVRINKKSAVRQVREVGVMIERSRATD
jgi:dihydroneopterin aldolase